VKVRSISAKQGQQQQRDPAHALIRRVDRYRVSQRPHPDAPPGQVMHEVEDLTQVAADPVERVDDDDPTSPWAIEASRSPDARELRGIPAA
jgi:hypothetical protein